MPGIISLPYKYCVSMISLFIYKFIMPLKGISLYTFLIETLILDLRPFVTLSISKSKIGIKGCNVKKLYELVVGN